MMPQMSDYYWSSFVRLFLIVKLTYVRRPTAALSFVSPTQVYLTSENIHTALCIPLRKHHFSVAFILFVDIINHYCCSFKQEGGGSFKDSLTPLLKFFLETLWNFITCLFAPLENWILFDLFESHFPPFQREEIGHSW